MENEAMTRAKTPFQSVLEMPTPEESSAAREREDKWIAEQKAEFERKRIAELPAVWERKIGEAFIGFDAAMRKIDVETGVADAGNPATVMLALGLMHSAMLADIADALRGIEWYTKENG
jgi:hypothetical protein